jgi:hypothetical protein
VLAPLLLMIVGLGGWRWFERFSPVAPPPAPQAATVAPTAAPSTTGVAPADPAGDGIGLIVGPATPWAVAGLADVGQIGAGQTEAAPAVVSGEATDAETAVAPIPLLGPPSGSVFGRDDVVSFYWSWPGKVGRNQQFIVYLAVDGARSPLGVVDEANLGSGFQLQAAIGEAAGGAGSYVWQVFLEDSVTGATLGQSEARTIAIIEN